MMILPNHKIRSFIPQESGDPVQELPEKRRPGRRKEPEVLVLRESVLGVVRSTFRHLPAEVWNGLVAEARTFLDKASRKLDAAYAAGIESRLPDVLSRDIPQLVYEAGRDAMEVVLRRERGFMGTTIKCHEKGCSNVLVYEGDTPRNIGTQLGMLTGVRRAYYHGACKHSAFPLDSLLGLDKHGLLPTVQEPMALMASRMSFPEATDVLNRLLPLKTNHTTVERVTETMAHELQAIQEDRRRQTFDEFNPPAPEYPAGSRVAVAAADGGMFRTRNKNEPYHEFKAGVMGWLEPVSTSEKPVVSDKRYIAHVEEIDSFWEYLTAEYHRMGFSQAKTLVGLADGALHFLNRFELLQQPGQEVFVLLDFWHATEHLAEVGKTFYGDTPAAAEWTHKLAKALKRSKLKTIFRELDILAQQADTDKREETATLVRDKIRYFTDRKRFLRYKEARRRGFPIGSGMIEGAVRFVGKDRLHSTGMRWSDEGADEILQLRSLDSSGEWDIHCRRRAEQRQAAHQERQAKWKSLAA